MDWNRMIENERSIKRSADPMKLPPVVYMAYCSDSYTLLSIFAAKVDVFIDR